MQWPIEKKYEKTNNGSLSRKDWTMWTQMKTGI